MARKVGIRVDTSIKSVEVYEYDDANNAVIGLPVTSGYGEWREMGVNSIDPTLASYRTKLVNRNGDETGEFTFADIGTLVIDSTSVLGLCSSIYAVRTLFAKYLYGLESNGIVTQHNDDEFTCVAGSGTSPMIAVGGANSINIQFNTKSTSGPYALSVFGTVDGSTEFALGSGFSSSADATGNMLISTGYNGDLPADKIRIQADDSGVDGTLKCEFSIFAIR